MKTIAALIATAAISAPAFAGGPVAVAEEPMIAPVAEAYVAPGMDWTGAYVGAQLGYGDVDTSAGDVDGPSGYGLLGGVHAGYRWDMGNWVAGTEVSFDKTSIEIPDGSGVELDNVTALKLMAGREIGNSLVYGTLGAAHAKISGGAADASDNGMVYGIGFDHALNERLTVGGEVLQHNFDDFDATGVDVDATTIKAKVGLRF